MAIFRRELGIACLVLVFLLVSAQAKRVTPKPVAPVISGGIRYSAAGDGRDQYVVAADATTGSVLWKVKVFHTHIKPWIEEDNQWVFISDLKLEADSLFVRDESSRCYSIDLSTTHVKKRPCSSAF